MNENFNNLKSKYYLWLALAVASVFVIWIQLPRILDPYALEEDLRTLFWVHRYQESDLFPTVDFSELGVIDISVGPWTFVNETGAPGYSLLLQLFSDLIPPILFTKLLAFPLMLASVYYLFKIGEKLSNQGTALALSLAFIIIVSASTSEISVLSGLHRSFAIPFTLALVYYLMIGSEKAALIVLFLDGLIYLPIFPVLVMTYILNYVELREDGQWKFTIQWPRLAELFIVVVLVSIVISPTIVYQLGRAENDVDTSNSDEIHLIDDPQFDTGGRTPLFVLFPLIGRGGLTSAALDGLHLLVLTFFAFLVLILRRSETTKPPPVLMKLLYASFIGFFLSWFVILLTSSFLLYLPSRHSRVGLLLFLLIFVLLNLKETLRASVSWVLQNRSEMIWYLLPIALITIGFAIFLPENQDSEQLDFRGPISSFMLIGLTLLLFILAILVRRRNSELATVSEKSPALPSTLNWFILGGVFFIGSIFYVWFMLPDFYSPTEDSIRLFEFVETLPNNALLAGSPCALDSIPFYGKRAVLFSCERYLRKQQMILDELRAFYAADGEQIYSFCQDYGVTHLVVDEKNLDPNFVAKGKYFFEPFDSILAHELMNRADFALNHLPEDQKLFQIDSIFIISCDRYLVSITTGH